MAEYDKQRRHRRHDTLDLPGSFGHSVYANVLNISLSGLAIRTATQLGVGRKYSINLGQEEERIHLSGTVVWCRLAGTQKLDEGDVAPVYQAGIALDKVFTERSAELLEFLRRNVIVELESRIFGRFSVESEDPVTLESKEDFVVKQLSLSGMLIATESLHEPEAVYELEIRLNRGLFRSRARIVHVDEAGVVGQRPSFVIGVEFLQPATEQLQLLEDFIQAQLEATMSEEPKGSGNVPERGSGTDRRRESRSIPGSRKPDQ